jgi:PKHD-type hydroxylase
MFMQNFSLKIKENEHLDDYVIYEDVFSPEECNMITGIKGYEEPSRIYTPDGPVVNLKYKDTKTIIISNDPNIVWVGSRLADILNDANSKYFKFNINVMGEVNMLNYKKDGILEWHTDYGPGEVATRKLSVVAFLSDRKDYQGGQLVFFPEQPLIPQIQGSVIVFPAYLLHKVEPVTSGSRYTLIAWGHGPTFR